MKINNIEISKLIPYEFNSRKHDETQINRIANSIKDFGFNQPIVIDESNIVLVGHGRLEAAKKLELKSVPVLQLTNLTETQKKAYRILDNKLQNDSTWDFDTLELDLNYLEDNHFNLESYGLDTLVNLIPEEESELSEETNHIELSENTFIKIGDLLELGDHRVVCGDSTKKEDVEACLKGSVPSLMVTDPPYGVNYDASWRSELDGASGKFSTGKVLNDNNADWGKAYILSGAEVCYVWHSGIKSKIFQESLEKVGYDILYQIIWNKKVMTFGRGDYHWKHEPCFYCAKKGRKHNYHGDRSQTTVWDIENNGGANKKEDSWGHSTQKPIECMARPIRNNSVKGDLIYDPFLGSGTTLVAADMLGRKCYGVELNPVYCQVILDRYISYCNQIKKKIDCKINGQDYKPIKL